MHSYKLSSLTSTDIKQFHLIQYYVFVGPTPFNMNISYT